MPRPPITLESANALLSRARIIIRGNKLYIRATLPHKRNAKVHWQQDISTKLSNNTEGIKIALLRAQKVESDLNLDKFQWSDWIDCLPENQISVEEASQAFEQWYWETRKRTTAREKDYKNLYQRFFNYLPQREALTGELLRSTLVSFEPDSYYRMRAYGAFGSLARWAKVELPQDWRFLKGKYQPKRDRVIPDDSQIEAIRESLTNPAWRWIFGMLAAYGLRPHELFYLDLSKFPVVRVLEETKTGARLVYPIHKRWSEEWNLGDRHFPEIITQGKTNKELGTKISQGFRDRKLGIVPYALRDAYAIRGARLGVDSLMMSKWMGHSVDVHAKHYLSYIDEVAMARIWEQTFREDLGK